MKSGFGWDGPVDELVKVAFDEFDSRKAYKAYHRHLAYKSKNSMEKAFRALLPLFGVMHRRGKFQRHDNDRIIVFANYAGNSLFNELRSSRSDLYGASMTKFLRHFQRVIRGGVYDEVRKTEKPGFLDFGYNCKTYTCGTVVSHDDVEAKMMIESLPALLWHQVCHECRFKDPFRSRVCAYILGRFVHGKRPVKKVLYKHFGLSKERALFFEDYVVVAARRILENMSPHVLKAKEDSSFLIEGGPLDSSDDEAA